jgi:hypothetical protein
MEEDRKWERERKRGKKRRRRWNMCIKNSRWA